MSNATQQLSMAQRLKEEVRVRIIEAATQAFVDSSFQRATVGEIANTAGTAVGNVYRYFSNKEDLFNAVVPSDFATTFLRHLRERVDALRKLHTDGGSKESVLKTQEQLLAFWISNRKQVIIILDRCDGTAFSGFNDQVVELLVDTALAHAQNLNSSSAADPSMKHVLRMIFRNTVKSIVDILENCENEKETRRLFALWGCYEMDGLNGLLGTKD